ncbi:radical SAM protein, partial [Lachnospiraceae bacterium AM25-17]
MDRHVMKKKKFYLYKKGVVLCLITIIQRKCDKIVMKKQENDEQMEKK